ncbi:hypothetical protein HMPREF9104_02386 [Lentilactobacillus kisonensis F0435]|uniref:Uncharacterized protein n=1 Tax=Lentilactobacillus kisonensis F0435 TaxID=797516 RepID=H1LIE5_9LACO|nr:hypothetical protein HMPREF9104_02386 [Lentilactobacillus kisonensis F0435]
MWKENKIMTKDTQQELFKQINQAQPEKLKKFDSSIGFSG